MSYRSEQTYAGPNHTTQITYEEAVGDNDDIKNNNATATTTTNNNNDKDKTTTKTNKLGTKIIKFQFSSSAGAGSGLFHSYRHERRREEERVKKMVEEKEKERRTGKTLVLGHTSLSAAKSSENVVAGGCENKKSDLRSLGASSTLASRAPARPYSAKSPTDFGEVVVRRACCGKVSA